MKARRVLGIDISLAHGAFVLLVDGDLADYRFVTDRKAVAEKKPWIEHLKNRVRRGVYLLESKIKDMQMRGIARYAFWNGFVDYEVIRPFAPTHVGIEDYAYRASQSAHQIGEIGGIVRYAAYSRNAKLRLHDPMTLKMFACHAGNLDAKTTRRKIEDRWPEAKKEFGQYVSGKDERTAEDLCDAYALAKLVDLEVQLRIGDVKLNLLHPKEVQVFNRCTKRYPESLLAREWIQRSIIE